MRLATAPEAANDADRRRIRWERRTQSRWMFTAAVVFVVVILTLTADFVYARVSAAPPEAQTVAAQNGVVRIPTAQVNDGSMHFFHRGRKRHFLALHCHTQTRRHLGHGARRLYDLRMGRLPAERLGHGVPKLRLGNLHTQYRATGRLQSGGYSVARRRRRPGASMFPPSPTRRAKVPQ